MSGASRCAKCGSSIGANGTGRPAFYCSQACRRSAEFEIRRLTRRLETLETDRHMQRRVLVSIAEEIDVSSDDETALREDRDGGRCVVLLREIEAEIARCETRLRALLADPTTEATPAAEPPPARRARTRPRLVRSAS